MGNVILSVVKNRVPVWSEDSLPELDGELKLPVLKDIVNIHRDEYGVVHIEAKNEHDMFAAQGYSHAVDRLWQMEVFRRVSSGRLSELFGADVIESDKFARTVGWRRLAQEDWDQIVLDSKTTNNNNDTQCTTAQALTAYVAGVNAYLDTPDRALPVEFRLASLGEVERWTELDTCTMNRLLGYQMSYGWQHSIVRAQLAKLVGIENCQNFDYEAHTDACIVPEFDFKSVDLENKHIMSENDVAVQRGQGSNCWAISGTHTENGHAVLCSDPHLTLNIPLLWHHQHLVCTTTGYNAAGVTVPAIPCVIIGKNTNIAWGITLAYADMEDVFFEKVRVAPVKKEELMSQTRGASTREYLAMSSDTGVEDWKALEVVADEVIHVKDADDEMMTVYATERGVLFSGAISNFFPVDKEHVLVAKHTQGEQKDSTSEHTLELSLCSNILHKHSTNMHGIFGLNRANNFQSFQKCTHLVNTASLSVVYADTKGNIGYQMTGAVPLRPKENDGTLPLPGWKSKYVWLGEVPANEMPFSYNPSCGYIVSANHKVVNYGDKEGEFKHYLGKLGFIGFRAKAIIAEIEQQINSGKKFSVEDNIALQHLVTNKHAEALCNALQRILPASAISDDDTKLWAKTEGESITLKAMRETFANLYSWAADSKEHKGCQMTVDSKAASIYTVFNSLLVKTIIDIGILAGTATGKNKVTPDKIDEEISRMVHHLGQAAGHDPVLKATSALEGCWADGAVLRLLESAPEDDFWLQNLGKKALILRVMRSTLHYLEEENPSQVYGDMHQIQFEHPMSLALGPEPFNRGPFAIPGDAFTPRMAAAVPHALHTKPITMVGATVRFVHELTAEGIQSQFTSPMGQSGQLGSKYYDNMTKYWLTTNEMCKMYTLQDKMAHTLVASPGDFPDETSCTVM